MWSLWKEGDDVMNKVLTVLLITIMVIAIIGAYSLAIWGVGSLFIYAFGLTYKWTFLKSLSVTLITLLLIPGGLKGEINLDKKRVDWFDG